MSFSAMCVYEWARMRVLFVGIVCARDLVCVCARVRARACVWSCVCAHARVILCACVFTMLCKIV